VGQLLDQTTQTKEYKDVYRSVHQDYRWTWEELKVRVEKNISGVFRGRLKRCVQKYVDATAAGLHSASVLPNKRLAVLVNNDTELVSFF